MNFDNVEIGNGGIDDELYGDIMAAAWEEERLFEKAENEKKEFYKRQLKGLLNTRVIWQWLNENDSWSAEGIYSAKIEDRYNYYYGHTKPHAQMVGAKVDWMHRQSARGEGLGISHYFVKQYCEFEDSYHGWIAIPLSDYRYFLISYSC